MSPDSVGRYKIKSELGRGGMATVYRAHDPISNREVAVKVLPREMLHNLLTRSRFKREMKMIASLEHPAIVPVYDVGEDDSQPFFVMRYMSGGSLTGMIKNGKFSLRDAALIIERLAAALDHAHTKKIIHRDIKPDNVLFDGSGHPYLSDFGVAKLTESAVSATGEEIIGTPAYISPEQARGESVDSRADVYGLGAILYEMLTGERPYSGDTIIGMALQHINEPVPDILNSRPDLPAEVDLIIKTAMAKDKSQRYATAMDLARALNHAAFGDERTTPASGSLMDRQTVPARRRRNWTIAGVTLIFLLFGYFGLRGQIPFLTPASSPTPSLMPVSTRVPVTETLPPPSPTALPATAQSTTPETIVPGGSDQIAFLAESQLYFMNTDGSNLVQIRTDNSAKSNLQWIPGNRLIYISRNCAFMVDGDTKENEEIVCFNTDETLEGFRVSPDGSLVAISIQRTLNIIAFDIPVLNKMDTRFNFIGSGKYCFYSQFPFRDVLWSEDQNGIAARVVDTELINSDQIFLLSVDIENCANVGPTRIDKFPGLNFGFTNKESTKKITSFDWDGDHRFLLNDNVRNDGFGDLYMYDSETLQETIINPIDGVCCYRDARWSPDGKYILFLFQRFDRSEVSFYYVPLADIGAGVPLNPIELPAGFLSPRDKPQPALRPVP
jgi:serine/threonine protein kinase